METRCHECGRTLTETHLTKCPICHRHFCDDHSYVWSGRTFCSKGCASHFFFDDEE